ncbi:MAG: ribosome silencing factor [Pirellulaceae bacterium]|nr:ribosome silencing factor [Pirellulaceae bacterium]
MSADPNQHSPANPSNQVSEPPCLVPQAQLDESLNMARAAVEAAAENRGQDILLLELTRQTSLFDYFVIATGASKRQLVAISHEIDRRMKTQFDQRKLSVSGVEQGRWIVLDYGSIVVHLFDQETREFYDLESLWGDARQIDISAIVAQASAQIARLQ